MPRGSITRFNFYIQSDMLRALLRGFGPMLLLDLALILLACLLLAWRAARSLRGVAAGIAQLARGEDVRLPERGIAAELAAQLNQTSALLQTQAARLARRDSARTQWIAGVSHDIRTPLSLIYLHAEELAADGALTDAQRARARVIGAQGQKIRALIEDLNLTSKLQYGAQPLRRARLNAGALLRQSLADFCNDPLSARCPAALSLSPEAERAFIWGDAALLRRAMDNLLGNSARHNPQGCAVQAEARGQRRPPHRPHPGRRRGLSPRRAVPPPCPAGGRTRGRAGRAAHPRPPSGAPDCRCPRRQRAVFQPSGRVLRDSAANRGSGRIKTKKAAASFSFIGLEKRRQQPL